MGFWDLAPMERKQIANERMRVSKYVVFDYLPSGNNTHGVLIKLGSPIDSGFVHGFVIDEIDEGDRFHELNVYSNAWYTDEKYEERTFAPYHIFTSLEKANEYLNGCRRNTSDNSLDHILSVTRRYYNDARIAHGRRGYETGVDCYDVVTFGCGYITIKPSSQGGISFSFNSVVIPHSDILPVVLDIYKRFGNDYTTAFGRMLDWVGRL